MAVTTNVEQLDWKGYLDFVIEESEILGKLFILDSGEGRDYCDPKTGWYVEDLSGWLIDPQDQRRFLEVRDDPDRDKAYDVFGDDFVFAIWSVSADGDLSVDFRRWDSFSI
jgi:hypothetical protein